jgi:hypothetical protein
LYNARLAAGGRAERSAGRHHSSTTSSSASLEANCRALFEPLRESGTQMVSQTGIRCRERSRDVSARNGQLKDAQWVTEEIQFVAEKIG